MRNNSLEGSLPTTLANLSNLEFVFLRCNRLSGVVTDGVAVVLPSASSSWCVEAAILLPNCASLFCFGVLTACHSELDRGRKFDLPCSAEQDNKFVRDYSLTAVIV